MESPQSEHLKDVVRYFLWYFVSIEQLETKQYLLKPVTTKRQKKKLMKVWL